MKTILTQAPSSPTPDEIKAFRVSLHLTQAQAAEVIYSGVRAWQEWEAGNRAMHPAMWELFTIKAPEIAPRVYVPKTKGE